MRILVAGASGRTGRLFTTLALERGHEVTALVRNPALFDLAHEHLRVVRADVLDPSSLASSFAGQNAVVSMVAPHPDGSGRVLIEGTRNLANGAAAAGVRRIVVVSAEGAGVAPRNIPLLYRVILHIPFLARLYPDVAHMDRDLAARSDLDWTIVRPPILTNGPRADAYRTAVGEVVPDGLHLSRADLAAFLLEVVEQRLFVEQRVAIAH